MESELGDTDTFRWDLQESANHGGFDLKFVSVIGPDYANLARGIYSYDEEVMFSDTGRPADFITADGLLTLPRCTAWSKLPREENRIPPLRRRELYRDESQEYVCGFLSAGQMGETEPGSQDGVCGYAAGRAYLEGLDTAINGLPAPTQQWKKCKDYAKGYTDGLKTLHNDDDLDDDRTSKTSNTDTQSTPSKKWKSASNTGRRTC